MSAEAIDNGQGFFLAEHGGDALGPLGGGGGNGAKVDFQDVFVEEEQGAKGLVLGGGGHVAFDGQVGEGG